MVCPLAAEIPVYIKEGIAIELENSAPTIAATVDDPIQSANLPRRPDFVGTLLLLLLPSPSDAV
jgi:hypothetical protein